MKEKGRPALLTREKGKRSWASAVLTAVAAIVLLFVFAGIVFRNRYATYEIDGPSMQDTLFTGDWVYADRTVTARRGDVVIVDVSARSAFSRGTIVKRLIAVGGDAVKCEEGIVYRRIGEGDYVPLDEPYVTGKTRDFDEVVLREGEIFVMGDNRTDSFDCRSPAVGPLSVREIVGVVPGWALGHKQEIARWELFRSGVRNFIIDLFD